MASRTFSRILGCLYLVFFALMTCVVMEPGLIQNDVDMMIVGFLMARSK